MWVLYETTIRGVLLLMSYALEHEAEFDRLEKQSSLEPYDYRNELRDLIVTNGATILDAGCGSGVVSRYLAGLYPNSCVIGCDASTSRVQQARQSARSIRNLTFENQELTNLNYGDDEFNVIVCRYVVQHQIPRDVNRLIGELARVLKPGGTLLAIDVDGLMHNLYPQSACVQEGLQRLIEAEQIDLFVGRKLPMLLSQAGLTSISWRIEALLFRDSLKAAEMELMRDRFDMAAPFFEELLGGRKKSLAFQKEYLKCMDHSEAVTYFTKFIVSGVKSFR
jgi:ubiquinone/menaquinone biosynthesis C-methylase UbiE